MPWITLLALVLAVPSAAHASTVALTVRNVPGYKGSGYDEAVVTVVAAPAEANDVGVRLEQRVAIVTDSAGAQPGPGCALSAFGETRCPVPLGATVVHAEVDAGDAGDTVSVGPGVGATVRLGPGNDRAWVADRFLDGYSALHGGPGDDVLGGGDGFDVLDGGPGADQMSGGAGHDTLSYRDRTAPVSATIGGPGGEAGEGDAIGADIEEIQGGAGPDLLRGGPRDDVLWGGGGDDDIDGGAGNDNVNGEDGANRVAGGAGDDYVSADGPSVLLGGPGDDAVFGGAGADIIDAGPGRDKAGSYGGADRLLLRDGEADEGYCPARSGSAVADGRDLVVRCASIDRKGPGHVMLHVDRMGSTRRFYRVHLLCSSDLRPTCAGVVRLLTRGRPAGRARFAVPAGHVRTVSIELRRGARRRLVSARRLALVVRVDTHDAAGRPVVLRAPGTARAR